MDPITLFFAIIGVAFGFFVQDYFLCQGYSRQEAWIRTTLVALVTVVPATIFLQWVTQ